MRPPDLLSGAPYAKHGQMDEKKHYLAVCCIVKDEDPYLAEWLTYHSLIGVEHFFVYDNMSAAPLEGSPLIRKLTAQGRLTLRNIPGRAMQVPAYLHCLQNYGALCKWLAFIDLDEVICPLEMDDLRILLAESEDYAGLALNWKCFGANGYISRPPGLVIRGHLERFVPRYATNLHIKSVIQPDKIDGVRSPHAFLPLTGAKVVNEHFRPLPFGSSFNPMSFDRACVHHYLLKSQEDLEHRLRRGRADIVSREATITYEQFYAMLQEPQEKDESILRFAARVEDYLRRGEFPYPGGLDLPEAQSLEQYTGLAGLFMEGQRLAEAEILLCRASLRYADKAQLWVARACLAKLQKQVDRAWRFLKKALSLDELPQAYEELLDLCIMRGWRQEARAALEFMLHAPTVRTDSEALNRKLDIAKKLLHYRPA
jgi:hypothetical protein